MKLYPTRYTTIHEPYWREDSIKTRIETGGSSFCGIVSFIEEKIPLKQGLKHSPENWLFLIALNWREDSIKTRIETLLLSVSHAVTRDWREDSIKTRIETSLLWWQEFVCWHWREDSIKTRIETSYVRIKILKVI